MPIEDINRIGPNQDINDPSLLIEVGFEFNKTSKQNGDMLAKVIENNISATGNKIIDIVIPLKILDGTITDFNCENITRDEENESLFIYDKVLWSGGLINTYVDLAEKFRDYWKILNNIIGDIETVNDFNTENIPGASGAITFGASGYLDSFKYNGTKISFSPSGVLNEPTWSGNGPTNYNSGTYPQLLNEAFNVRINISSLETFTDIREFYYWKRTDNASANGAGLSRVFGVSSEDVFQGPPNIRLEIPNFTDNDLEITMFAFASCSKSSIGIGSPFGASSISADVFGNAGYGHHGATIEYIFLDGFSVGNSASTPEGPSSSNTVSISHTMTVTIPPHRSGFFVVHASAGGTFNLPPGEPVSCTNITLVTLNGRTRNHTYSSGQ